MKKLSSPARYYPRESLQQPPKSWQSCGQVYWKVISRAILNDSTLTLETPGQSAPSV